MKLKQAEVDPEIDHFNLSNVLINFIFDSQYARPLESKLRSKKGETYTSNLKELQIIIMTMSDGTVLPIPPQLNFTPPSDNDEMSIIGSILPDGIALPTPPQLNFTSPSNSNKVRVASQIGSILPDGTVLPTSSSQPNFIPVSNSNEVSLPSLQITFNDDNDGKSINEIYFVNISQCAEVLKKKKTLSPVKRTTLRYDHIAVLMVLALDEKVNAFIADVEKIVQKGGSNEAYKYCLEKHTNSPNNTSYLDLSLICFHNLFKVKDGDDLLDCKEGYTEIDIIVKICSYIVKGLRKGLRINCKYSSRTDLGEWEFSAHCINAKAIGDHYYSARINQSILNAILRLNLTKEQIPTKLAHIKKLKSTVKIFKYVMEMYEEVDGILYELDHGYNSLNYVFNVKIVNGASHYKSNFIHDPWWTPKKNVSSQLIIAFEEMENFIISK
ncbi:hypothetical protein C1645_824920 [Glomus cerebriforme]|uniref:Uncharacterized protein n=1 Tax=Glomus cerebriforme TaxID=658196 RepID=A0A397T2L1_9GLOM|nr:hypothetical protein C1645_824920 [Glomus cerebriforme]